MKTKEELYKESKKLKDDVERWKWVKENQNEENMPPVQLDNDDTFVLFGLADDKPMYMQFSNFIGYNNGVFELLEAMGIESESV